MKQLTQITKSSEGYKVVYIHNLSFYQRIFSSLMEAVRYAETELKSNHEETILSINK